MENKYDVIIIGAGLIGSATAKYFAKRGLSSLILDSKEPMAASKCSFGVWKEGWVNENIRPFVFEGIDLLEELCSGMEKITFWDMKRNEESEMFYVNCANILDIQKYQYSEERVQVLKEDAQGGINVFTNSGKVYQSKRGVIVAAGAYTDTLLVKSGFIHNIHNLDTYWGATLDVKMRIEENRILEWAPYKQSVLLKKRNGFVFGDGASVKNPKLSDPRIKKTSERLVEHLDQITQAKIDIDKIQVVNEGWRPYLKKGDFLYVKQHRPKLWSATGGAKNTTILCGYIAQKLFDDVIGSVA